MAFTVMTTTKISVYFTLIFVALCLNFMSQKCLQDLRLGAAIPYQKYKTTVIHIATVVCDKPGSTWSREEATVMIKSVIISAIIYKVPKIKFHVLVEREEDGNHLKSKLQELGVPLPDVKVSLTFYVISKVLAVKYLRFMKYGDLRCMHMRYFLPRVLQSIDSVLYFDTDFIVLGDVAKFWNFLGEMDDFQMIGTTVNRDSSCLSKSPFNKGTPLIIPNGVASGMLVMNLTRMRQQRYIQKYMQAFKDYSKLQGSLIADQAVVNSLFFYNPRSWQKIPCHYNFWEVYCTDPNIMCCRAALEDPSGIVAIAGAANTFAEGKLFREIFIQYQKINIATSRSNFTHHLMEPIRQAYMPKELVNEDNSTNASTKPNVKSKCDGRLGVYLFSDYFD